MKVLVKTIAGSHLFGTNTPSSDTDYKGVFLPSSDEILLGNYKDTIIETTGSHDSRNNAEDVDVELYSLKKFMKMIANGDTAALELLFTPEEYILEKHPLWEVIIENRDKLLSSKVNAMIGYARQQANKYGIKGSRMGELNKIIALLKDVEKEFDFPNPKLKHGWDKIVPGLEKFDHVHLITLNTDKGTKETPGLDILGKKFDHHCTFPHVLQILNRIYKNYGQRAREAKKNNGIDWKALSHAARVSFQGLELLRNKTITLPLKGDVLDTVKHIKQGNVDYKDVSKLLEELLDELEAAKKTSELPEQVDQGVIDTLIIVLHNQSVRGRV